jgi:peptidoglycan/LPS O-acetylase OafA/YrhL
MRKYFYSLDYLRGFAAISVCFYHFTHRLNYLSDTDLFKQIFSVGHFGVEIFFIISGLVIPYSMAKGNYTLQKFFTFLKKRFIRIEPPYLICVLLALLLNYLTTLNPLYDGKAFQIDYAQLFYHFGYLNGFMGKDWLNGVFWTLAVEFQYYLLIALLFPLINHKSKLVWIPLLIVFNLTSFYFDRNYIFNFSIFFTAGILLFRYFTNQLDKIEQVISIFCVTLFTFVYYSYSEVLVVVLTCLVAMAPLEKAKLSSFFGDISYSLYLLHFPIGLRLINLTQRFSETQSVRHLMILAAFLFSVLVSYWYYKIIEKPFKEMSKQIKYNTSSNLAEIEPAHS